MGELFDLRYFVNGEENAYSNFSVFSKNEVIVDNIPIIKSDYGVLDRIFSPVGDVLGHMHHNITIEGGRVVYLDISEQGYESFPREIYDLECLKRINLSHNNIKRIPGDILKLKNLEEVTCEESCVKDLSKNLLNMKSLKSVYFKGNPLSEESYFILDELEKNGVLVDYF